VFEISETESDALLTDWHTLKDVYLAWAQERYLNKNPPVVVKNIEKDWDIEITGRVISEWKWKTRTRHGIIAIKLLEQMCETAAYSHDEIDTKNSSMEVVHIFKNLCKVNGKDCAVTIKVKKHRGKDRRFAYYYVVSEIPTKKLCGQ
jgi:hypothetical protein